MTDYIRKSDDQLMKIYANIRKKLLTSENFDIIDKFEDVIIEQTKRLEK